MSGPTWQEMYDAACADIAAAEARAVRAKAASEALRTGWPVIRKALRLYVGEMNDFADADGTTHEAAVLARQNSADAQAAFAAGTVALAAYDLAKEEA